MGKFVISRDLQTIIFQLVARNGEEIAASLPFSSLTACKRCIQSVIRTAPIAKIEDLCSRTKGPTVTNPKFEIYRDKTNAFRFRLKARNGEVILISSAYTTKASCKNGIASVIKNSGDAETVILN